MSPSHQKIPSCPFPAGPSPLPRTTLVWLFKPWIGFVYSRISFYIVAHSFLCLACSHEYLHVLSVSFLCALNMCTWNCVQSFPLVPIVSILGMWQNYSHPFLSVVMTSCFLVHPFPETESNLPISQPFFLNTFQCPLIPVHSSPVSVVVFSDISHFASPL